MLFIYIACCDEENIRYPRDERANGDLNLYLARLKNSTHFEKRTCVFFSGVGMDSLDASEQESLNSMPGTSSSDPTLQDTEVYCSEPAVTSFIKSYIRSAQLVENVGSELTYVLPAEMAREGHFQDMFEELDKSLDKLHIGSYGVSDTTLEEVRFTKSCL